MGARVRSRCMPQGTVAGKRGGYAADTLGRPFTCRLPVRCLRRAATRNAVRVRNAAPEIYTVVRFPNPQAEVPRDIKQTPLTDTEREVSK